MFVMWIGRRAVGAARLDARWMVAVLALDERWVARVAVIGATGDLDMVTAPKLRDAVAAALQKKPAGLIIDLSTLEFLGSAGMQVLIEARSQTPEIPFAVVADGPATSRVLRIIGITDVLDVFPTMDAALAHF